MFLRWTSDRTQERNELSHGMMVFVRLPIFNVSFRCYCHCTLAIPLRPWVPEAVPIQASEGRSRFEVSCIVIAVWTDGNAAHREPFNSV